MSTSSTLKLALELAAKVTGREDLAALAGEVSQMSDYAYRLIEPTSCWPWMVRASPSMWLVKRQCDLDGRTAGLSAVYKKNFSWLWEASVMQLVIFSGVFIQFLDYRTFLGSTGLILCFI